MNDRFDPATPSDPRTMPIRPVPALFVHQSGVGPIRRPFELDSVPDGRFRVPSTWWLPLVALAVLALTVVEVLGLVPLTPAGAVTVLSVCAAGYLGVSYGLRALGASPASSLTGRDRPPGRPVLLIASALVGLGASYLVSFAVAVTLRPHPPVLAHRRMSIGTAWLQAALAAVNTSILEECGIALIILAAAGLAGRLLPRRWDPRSTGLIAVTAGTLTRVLLHIPLWGLGAVGRVGLSLILAWLFWRTRRIWPLIAGHVLWDTLALQTVLSPALEIKALSGLTVLGWGIAGSAIAIVALVRTRRRLIRERTWAARFGRAPY